MPTLECVTPDKDTRGNFCFTDCGCNPDDYYDN